VLGGAGTTFAWTNGWQTVSLAGARIIGQRRAATGTPAAGGPAATVTALGKGHIAAVYGPVVSTYLKTPSVVIRELIATVMREAFPQPAVETDAPSTVDLALRRTRDGKWCVHFLNLAKVQRDDKEFPPMDPYPAVGPFAVRLRLPQKPAAVRWEPEGRQVAWTWQDGLLTATIPGLEIHGVLVVE
jgi:hypothetical protein